MHKSVQRIHSALIVMFLLITSVSYSQYTGPGKNAAAEHHVNWMTFEEAVEAHQKEPRKWVIDVWTSWCGWCKRMDATTFSDSIVANYINENFYPVSLDGEYKKDIVVGDKTFKFVAEGRRGYHELPATLMNGKMSYPTIVFLNEQMQNLGPVPGYKSAKDFHPIIQFMHQYDGENPTTWEDFQKSYVSPYEG